jgi:hypothetical protein
VVNVHTTCLKEIEELNFNSTTETLKKSNGTKVRPVEQSADLKDSMEIPLAGQKRTYVDA